MAAVAMAHDCCGRCGRRAFVGPAVEGGRFALCWPCAAQLMGRPRWSDWLDAPIVEDVVTVSAIAAADPDPPRPVEAEPDLTLYLCSSLPD